MVKYLRYLMDKAMSGEAKSPTSKLKFLYRKNDFLTPALIRLLCIALIQPLFDYVCSAWYPNLAKKLKHRIQTT